MYATTEQVSVGLRSWFSRVSSMKPYTTPRCVWVIDSVQMEGLSIYPSMHLSLDHGPGFIELSSCQAVTQSSSQAVEQSRETFKCFDLLMQDLVSIAIKRREEETRMENGWMLFRRESVQTMSYMHNHLRLLARDFMSHF